MPSLVTVQKGLDCGVVKSPVVRVAVKLQSGSCTAIGNASDLGDNFSGLSTCSSYWHGHQTPHCRTASTLQQTSTYLCLWNTSRKQEGILNMMWYWMILRMIYQWISYILCHLPHSLLGGLVLLSSPMDGIYLSAKGWAPPQPLSALGKIFFWESLLIFGKSQPCKNLWILESIPQLHFDSTKSTLQDTSRIRFRDYFAQDLTCKSL